MTIQFTQGDEPDHDHQVDRLRAPGRRRERPWGDPSNVNLNSDPRAKITYDPTTNTATLDYTGLPQTEMPTDRYAIVVLSPRAGRTGRHRPGRQPARRRLHRLVPLGRRHSRAATSFEDLGIQTLQAPVVTSFQMTPQTDTGIAGDQNTNTSQPQFIGQVFNGFPGTVANLQVYIEFNGLHPELNGGFDLAVGGGGRGFAPAATTTSW